MELFRSDIKQRFSLSIQLMFHAVNHLNKLIVFHQTFLLRKNNRNLSIKTLNSDKGNATVILDINTYDKMLSNPEVYKPIPSNSNPISTIQKQVNQILNQFAKDHKITVPVYYHLILKCDKSVTLKSTVYQKSTESVPLRPIVSFIGSLLHILSKFLVGILSPIVNLEFCAKNSSQFVDKISRVKLNPDE